jgi:hypothetical protein
VSILSVMFKQRLAFILVPLVAAAGIAAGCGSSSHSASTSSSAGAEAKSAATGDIPDTQNFLAFKDPGNKFSIRYPEGWAQTASTGGVTFKDKNNAVRVEVRKGSAPTVASVAADLKRLKASDPAVSAPAPRPFSVKGRPAIKVTYTTVSKPNPVTGKREALVVDRYVLGKGGKVAVVDLGTAKGVDNVDAYRMMIESFRWL